MLFPDQVLLHYPDLCQGPIQDQPQIGLNGGVCYRVQALVGDLCLKAWPAIHPQHLVQVHRLLQHSATEDLYFLPRVYSTGDGITYWKDATGRLWDLTTWMPGQIVHGHRITVGQIRSAAAALVKLHLSWFSVGRPLFGIAPAVNYRLKAWKSWEWWPSFNIHQGVQNGWQKESLEKADALLSRWMHNVPNLIGSWQNRPLPLQWRHGDPWTGNLLFTGDQLTGLIDFGSATMDSPSADLARLLGSLAGENANLWQAGEDAYAALRPLSLEERTFLIALDRSGVLVSLLQWLDKVCAQKPAVATKVVRASMERIEELINRIEKWQ